jgi:caffeoyl-CoA O-methyltransferase
LRSLGVPESIVGEGCVAFKSLLGSEGLARYVNQTLVQETGLQRRLRAETAQLPAAGMQIAADQGAFLAFLVRLIGARRALEVGTFTGYSALAMALALPEDGRLIACDISEEWTSIGRRYWEEAGVSHKIDLRLGPAGGTLEALLEEGRGGTFDFAFIDADKTGYDVYYERVLELLRPGGLVAVDNTLWEGKVADPTETDPDTEAIRAFNLKVRSDERVTLSLVPIGDGLTLARKRG